VEKKVCSLKRVSKCSVRKYCCKNNKCKWVGKEIKEGNCHWVDHHQECSLKTVGECLLRKHCCKVKGHNRVCHFIGANIKDKNCGHTTCRMFSVGPCLERRQCCKNGVCRWIGHNIRLHGCNIPPLRMVQCSSYADPHMVGFAGNRFEAQDAGTFDLYSGEKLSVSYSSIKMGAWAAIISVSVNVNGHSFNFGRHFSQQSQQLDGAASITRNGNRITVNTGDGEEIDIVTHGNFLDVFVRSNKSNTGGMCANGYNQRPQHKQPCLNNVARNRMWCNRNNKHNARNCVFDLCNGLKRRDEIKIKREVRKEKRKRIHINWNRFNHKVFRRPHRPVHHRPHRPVHRPIFRPHRPQVIHRPVPHRPVHRPQVIHRPPPPRPVFRPRPPPPRPVFRPTVVRRGRGDVWMQKKKEENGLMLMLMVHLII